MYGAFIRQARVSRKVTQVELAGIVGIEQPKPFVHAGDRHELPFLSAEDLTVFKISFGRTKDWVDIEAMVTAGTAIDPDYIEHQLVGLKGSTAYPAAARFRALLRGQPQ
jgi:transcriptional regulator with XRE-family HTH domain